MRHDKSTAMSTPAKRPVIVVLGMPRSGTSLLANLVHVLGVSLGDNLLHANQNNPEGYWENADICQVQQEILDGPSVFDVPTNSVLPIPVSPEPSPAFTKAKEQLIELLTRELGRAPGLWGFKDSRTSRLLPLWKEVFDELNVEPIYLLALRHPLAVAASMAKLWETSPGLAQLMWITHNLEVLTSTRSTPVRMVVDYDRWFTQPREQLAALVAALRLPPAAADADTVTAALARVKSDLRHNHGDLSACLPWVAETYTLLQEAAVIGTLPAALWSIEEQLRPVRAFIHHSMAGLQDPVVSQAARERQKRIDRLDALCREQRHSIGVLDKQCRDQAQTVAALDRLCREQAESIAALDRLCREQAETVTTLDRLCHEKDAAIAALSRPQRTKSNAA